MITETDYVGTIPTRRDVTVIPTDNTENLELGFVGHISPVMMVSGFGGSGYSCSKCNKYESGYCSYQLAQIMGDFHMLNHKEYQGGSRRSNFDMLIAEQLRHEENK